MAARSDMEVYFAPLLRGGVRRPAIHPAEYGHPWSWAGDTLAAWHNGLRAELVDLFNIVESMTVRRSELGDRELDEAYAWWVLFRRFLGDYWAVEHLLLFPWIFEPEGVGGGGGGGGGKAAGGGKGGGGGGWWGWRQGRRRRRRRRCTSDRRRRRCRRCGTVGGGSSCALRPSLPAGAV